MSSASTADPQAPVSGTFPTIAGFGVMSGGPVKVRTTVDVTRTALEILCTKCDKLSCESQEQWETRMRMHEKLCLRFRAIIDQALPSDFENANARAVACLPYIDIVHRLQSLYRTTTVEVHAFSKLHTLTQVDAETKAHSLSDLASVKAYDLKWREVHSELLQDLLTVAAEFLHADAKARGIPLNT